jgi:hypothetical protein
LLQKLSYLFTRGELLKRFPRRFKPYLTVLTEIRSAARLDCFNAFQRGFKTVFAAAERARAPFGGFQKLENYGRSG